MAQKVDDRSHMVENPEEGTYCRNRFHLRKTGELHPPKLVEPTAATSERQPIEITPQQQPAVSSNIPVPPTVPENTETHSRLI